MLKTKPSNFSVRWLKNNMKKNNYNLTPIVKFGLCVTHVPISVNKPSRFKTFNIFRANRARIFSPGFKPKPWLSKSASYDIIEAIVCKMENRSYREISISLKYDSFSLGIKCDISYYLSHVIASAI